MDADEMAIELNVGGSVQEFWRRKFLSLERSFCKGQLFGVSGHVQ